MSISKALLVKHGPHRIGEQIKINHEGCSAGKDTKERLYIKRTEKGLMAYCHHCSQSGFSDRTDRLGTWVRPAESTVAGTTFITPDFPLAGPLPIVARYWLQEHHVPDKEFVGSATRTELQLPIYDHIGVYVGVQCRSFATGGPKYRSYFKRDCHKGRGAWFRRFDDGKRSSALVITEDYISAYRVYFDTGVDSFALLRTTITVADILLLASMEYETILIWLDPDHAGREGAKKIHESLTHYLPTNTLVVLLKMDMEPKECPPYLLKDCLT